MLRKLTQWVKQHRCVHDWDLINEAYSLKFIFPCMREVVLPSVNYWIWKCKKCEKAEPFKGTKHG